ncbi:polysaccharide deacetylase [Pleurocapsa sp. PCC 7319]|uniref:polysaccharide deacetylase family protein n=1 Tax=Pleurocapsa sp. PCC 7319 TaxID=118161 RepID=UPI000346742C|nr:polysaccharide deacetylase [Pleurocapsa sp. PCC 7319]
MTYNWSENRRCAAVLSFDVDGESGILAEDPKMSQRLSAIAWARYGPKTGVPRILDMLKKQSVQATFFVPGYTAELYPDLVKRISDEGHEIGVHGYLHEKVSSLDLIQEETALVKTCDILEKITGTRPIGYRAPLWDVNDRTPELLASHGMVYDSSLMDDDVPYTISTPKGDLIEIPPHWTNDDWEQFAFHMEPKIGSGVIETCAKALQLWQEEVEGMHHYGRAFILTMHPELIGRPARVLMLEKLIEYMRSLDGVWLTTCGEIARYHQKQNLTATMSEVG